MVIDVLELAYIFLATFIVSLISFIGAVSLTSKDKMLNKILLTLICLSAGKLGENAFLYLLPKAVEKSIGLFGFNLIENVVLFILPFATGGFIYIAVADLVPEIGKDLDIKKHRRLFSCSSVEYSSCGSSKLFLVDNLVT
jgi:zinc transporter ZupT